MCLTILARLAQDNFVRLFDRAFEAFTLIQPYDDPVTAKRRPPNGIGQIVIRRTRCCRFEIFYSVRAKATLEHECIAATGLMSAVAIERVIA